jgi:hypothetical protein
MEEWPNGGASEVLEAAKTGLCKFRFVAAAGVASRLIVAL